MEGRGFCSAEQSLLKRVVGGREAWEKEIGTGTTGTLVSGWAYTEKLIREIYSALSQQFEVSAGLGLSWSNEHFTKLAFH